MPYQPACLQVFNTVFHNILLLKLELNSLHRRSTRRVKTGWMFGSEGCVKEVALYLKVGSKWGTTEPIMAWILFSIFIRKPEKHMEDMVVEFVEDTKYAVGTEPLNMLKGRAAFLGRICTSGRKGLTGTQWNSAKTKAESCRAAGWGQAATRPSSVHDGGVSWTCPWEPGEGRDCPLYSMPIRLHLGTASDFGLPTENVLTNNGQIQQTASKMVLSWSPWPVRRGCGTRPGSAERSSSFRCTQQHPWHLQEGMEEA